LRAEIAFVSLRKYGRRRRVFDFCVRRVHDAIGGPTGAFVVVVFVITERYGVDGLFRCTLIAGVILGRLQVVVRSFGTLSPMETSLGVMALDDHSAVHAVFQESSGLAEALDRAKELRSCVIATALVDSRQALQSQPSTR
jgi:hypothetical protein